MGNKHRNSGRSNNISVIFSRHRVHLNPSLINQIHLTMITIYKTEQLYKMQSLQ